ncbi:reverse transcriptase [Gossypium australe]|uniref:Reverse transcriptase n=1 Tax=Gossypium australe TaxID=47621 RepID=A0A5B6VC16_9ROSI|nr:reverse transcriptase [Gossypium australe]
MMERMGFDRSWVEIIMKCIISVSYLVIVNREAEEVFRPTRGLRQGDPLSLFLFLICSEELSAFMRLVSRDGLIKGVNVIKRGPQISHLLFVDNCVPFGEANVQILLKEIDNWFHGWCLITYLNYLQARVLQAKYYPNSDFLNARLRNLPSNS